MPRRRKPSPLEPRLFSELIPGRLTIFDLETTGLDVRQGARALEICAVRLDNGNETGRIDTLLDPGVPIPADASAIHGITCDMVKGFPSLDDSLVDFITLASGGALAAYNASFDMSFIDDAASRCNIAPSFPVIDLIPLARSLFPRLSTYQLWQIKKALGLTDITLHRAAADVEVSVALWRRWLGLFNADNPEEAVNQALLLSRRALNPDRTLIQILRVAVSERQVVSIYYEGNQTSCWRDVEPLLLVKEHGAWVIKAFCRLRNEDRTFALSRIRQAKVKPDASQDDKGENVDEQG